MEPTKSKRKLYTKNQFSDQEAYEEIKDDIRDIRDKKLNQVQEEKEINKIYEDKRRELKRRKMEEKEEIYKKDKSKRNVEKKGPKFQHDLGEEDEEEGQISEQKQDNRHDRLEQDMGQMPSMSIRNLGEHIRPITLTRNKVCQMLMSRNFEDYVKGCFVRYKSESSSENTNSYMLAQIIGVVEGNKEYILNKYTKTKKLLKLQQSSEEVITLSIELLSNQHPTGTLEISAWIRTNRNKIPKEKQLKQKLEDLNKLMYGKVSSEEIDKNIYQEAVALSQEKTKIQGDFSKYIYFIEGQLHDINVSLEELESKHSLERRGEIDALYIKKEKHQEIISKLKKKKAEYEQEKAALKKNNEEKEKKALQQFSQIFFDDRKDDKINDKVKQKTLMISSHQGALNAFMQIKDVHRSYKIDIQL